MEDLVIRAKMVAGDPPVVVAQLVGKLNATTGPEFERFAAEAERRKILRVVLDIPDLKYMGSTGFEGAIRLAERLADAGGGVAVVHASPKIQVMFRTLGMERLFPVFPDLAGAISHLRCGVAAARTGAAAAGVAAVRPVPASGAVPPAPAAVGFWAGIWRQVRGLVGGAVRNPGSPQGTTSRGGP